MDQTTSHMGEGEQGWLSFFSCLQLKVSLVFTSESVKVSVKASRGAFAKKWPIASAVVSTYREMEAI